MISRSRLRRVRLGFGSEQRFSGPGREFNHRRHRHEDDVDPATENKMLQFTEVNSPPPHVYEIAEQFDRECDSDEYTAKIAVLLKKAKERDTKNSPLAEQPWNHALASLKTE